MNSHNFINENLSKPESIAVFPKYYFLFWIDLGDEPKIERSLLDGSDRIQVVRESIIWPTGLAIDNVNERIYWLDVKLHSINYCDLDGSK